MRARTSSEQFLAGRYAQVDAAGVADQPGRDADQPVPQGGDHGLAGPDAVAEQPAVGPGGRGELVQPAGNARGEQRTPHPGGVDLEISRR
jgi:hypothetical protein